MKIHLPWIRVTATAVLVAGVGVHQAAAQYAPYRPIPAQPAAPAAAAPAAAQQQAAVQNPYATAYTAYRTQPAAPANPYAAYTATQPTAAYAPQPTPALGSPTGTQYAQPSAAYPQYPQTANQQYPTAYGAYPRVAQKTPETMPLPAQPSNTSAAQPTQVMGTPSGAPVETMSAAPGAAPGGCGCNAATYGAGDVYTAPGCGGCPTGGYPNCNIGQYMGDTGCNDNQWFGGVYFLEMGRTNSSAVKLTSQMPTGGGYPYYPQPDATVLTTRDVDYGFREGLEVRIGSTFTIGDSCSACQSPCGGCNSCAPQTTFAWEVAWWGLADNPNDQMVEFDGTNRIYGMKSYAGLGYDHGAGSGYRPVNDYYDYQMPIVDPTGAMPPAGTNGYVRVVGQRIRSDFNAQNLELNFIRFPMACGTCSTGGCGGGDACGCNTNYTGCNGGCDDSCGCGFSMYGSCGVRYFHISDELMYGTDFQEFQGGYPPNGTFTTLNNNVEVKNDLIGPQVGWTSDYCLGRWNLFCNSTFGIFDNHQSVWQTMKDETGNYATYGQNGQNMNVKTNKDSVAFLGELRVGTAYDFSCHWRGVIAYRAMAVTGVATSSDQLSNLNTDQATTGIINSDNSMIIHGAQVGAECRY